MKKIIINKLKTSDIEIRDITKAWLILSLAFAFAFTNTSLLNGSIFNFFSSSFLIMFGVSLFTVGIGFLLHELAHKFVAQHYGCQAEFRVFDTMLYAALGLAVVVGFIFAAPGAVMIAGRITIKENGIISAAGPITNYVLAMFFMGLGFLIPKYLFAFNIGFMINMWLGLFNMIPFGNFDGIKILHYSRALWAALVAIGVYFVFFL